MVPVVMGAPRRDYERFAPPNSFIHVDDFSGPQALAKYLKLVGSSEVLYSKYLEWKKHYIMLGIGNWHCRLCALLNANTPPVWYDDIQQWYGHPDVCVEPSKENPWGSWKIEERLHGKRSVDFSKNSLTFG